MSITDCVVSFRATKSVKYLVFAVLLIIRQGRLTEVCWSVLSTLSHRPSPIKKPEEDSDVIRRSIVAVRQLFPTYLSREALIETYGKTFMLDGLPADFSGVRSESIAITDSSIVLGEYADKSARLVHANKEHLRVYSHYNSISGIRHIHSVHLSPCSSYVFVSTGDSKKYLDKWAISNSELRFSIRLASRLAGYTAAANVAGKLYFGTDFSSRPNYLETEYGERYPFPWPAYKKYVCAMCAIDDRYVISLNAGHPPADKAWTVSIFDTTNRNFIYSEFFKF